MHRVVAFPLLLGFALGCASTRAYSDFDPNARFDTYKTFAWLTPEAAPSQVQPGSPNLDPLLARRIRDTIDAHLEAKGYQRVPDREASDFVVSFSVGSREKISVQSTPSMGAGGWYGRYGGWYASSVSARSYTEGTLAIDIFDGKSHQAVWHGWASKRISDTADRAKLVAEVVGAILAKFPPQR